MRTPKEKKHHHEDCWLIPCDSRTLVNCGRVFCIERQNPLDAGSNGNSGFQNTAVVDAGAPWDEWVSWLFTSDELLTASLPVFGKSGCAIAAVLWLLAPDTTSAASSRAISWLLAPDVRSDEIPLSQEDWSVTLSLCNSDEPLPSVDLVSRTATLLLPIALRSSVCLFSLLDARTEALWLSLGVSGAADADADAEWSRVDEVDGEVIGVLFEGDSSSQNHSLRIILQIAEKATVGLITKTAKVK